ncbi:MAG: hypothetical protein IJU55_01540 [Selenomonadaceae bacterium]|nr:hypothetical protein [Selenomonadaceae bacterium]
MARQYKKILKKVQVKEKKSEPPKKKEKSWFDYLLPAFLALTAVVLFLGWESFTNLNRALYIFLTLTLGITYVRKNYNLDATQDKWAERAGYASMAVATVLFGIHFYVQYIS